MLRVHEPFIPKVIFVTLAEDSSVVRGGTKTTPVFLPLDGEAFQSLLPSSVTFLSVGTVQPENTYFCILKLTCQVRETQKTTLITTTTIVYLPKPVSTGPVIQIHF